MNNFDENDPKWSHLFEFAEEHGEKTIITSYRSISFKKSEETMLADIAFAKNHSSNHGLWTQDVSLQEKMAEGGMGFIYKGWQQSLQREVAIKTSRDERKLLFLAEAQITGRLDHSNIVPVHYIVQNDQGEIHIVMKMVKGHSWRELLYNTEEKNLSLQEHIKILISVCHATSYAHKQGIIHRDIKPENVMVGEFGQVFLMDWGLAVALDSELCRNSPIMHVSEVNIAAGTPGYMSPELAEGKGEEQDERTDVYLLGSTLHEIVTRSCRHQGNNMYAILQSIVASEPYNYGKNISSELATICNRATAKNPKDRYYNVNKFREALESYLEHFQADVLIDKGNKLTNHLQDNIKQKNQDKEFCLREAYRSYAEIRFAFLHALEIWPEAKEAKEKLEQATNIMLSYALEKEDLSLCLLLVDESHDKALHIQVDNLKKQSASKEKELNQLRDTVRLYNWQEIANPLGNVFIFSGIIGGLATIVTQQIVNKGVLPVYLLWAGILIAIGMFAFLQLRKRKAPKNFVSLQMIGLWGIIAFNCTLIGVIAKFSEIDMFRLIGCSSLMISIGLFTTAMQTNYVLFIPALLFMISGPLSAYYHEYGLEIFGICWFICLTMIGLTFRNIKKNGNTTE